MALPCSGSDHWGREDPGPVPVHVRLLLGLWPGLSCLPVVEGPGRGPGSGGVDPGWCPRARGGEQPPDSVVSFALTRPLHWSYCGYWSGPGSDCLVPMTRELVPGVGGLDPAVGGLFPALLRHDPAAGCHFLFGFLWTSDDVNKFHVRMTTVSDI